MDFLFTCDPQTIIIYRKDSIIIYLDLQSLEEWAIYGKCNKCGDCIIGANDVNFLPYELRQDVPLRPPTDLENCSLRGVYS